MEKVSAVFCSSYDPDYMYHAVQDALNRIGFSLPDNKTVLIKPNLMAQNKPEQHTITHFALIDALCRILDEHGCKIKIGDSSAFYQKGMTVKAFETSGLREVADRYGAKLVPFEKQPLVKIETGSKGPIKELYIPRILLDVDMVINACKLKSHGSMRLSGALKNMFGCLPGGYKQKMHIWAGNESELADIMLDIHDIVKPSVSIMDAVIALDGGPTALGHPVRMERILASTNAAALDVVGCRMIGYDPGEVELLANALKRNMIHSYDDVELIGDIVPKHFKHLKKGAFTKGKVKSSIFVTDTYVNPEIDRIDCNRCGHCVEICPVNAITFLNGKVSVDEDRCINCYRCCYECPVGAIKVSSSLLNKMIRAVRTIFRL